MTSSFGTVSCLLAVLLPSSLVAAPIGFDGPEVFKLDWNVRGLVDHDIDSDGRTDLLLLNNDSTKIEILYQRPPGKAHKTPKPRRSARRWEPTLDDGRFRRKSIPTGIKMYDLAVGDLDGDGRADLAFTGDPDGLTVLYQGGDGDWSRKRVHRDVDAAQWRSTVVIADADGDGRDELIVLAREELLVYASDDEGRLVEPRRYPLSEEDCYGLILAPLDGDSLPDLIYLAPRSETSLRVRFQTGDGRFGPERTFGLPTPRRDLQPVRLDDGVAFAVVHSSTGLIDFVRLSASTGESDLSGGLAARVYSTPTSENTAQNFALGDVDGDGSFDLVIGDREGARVWVYLQDDSGTFGSPTAYPSLSDIRSVAAGDADGDGTDELFVVSREERTIGMSRRLPDGRLSYPDAIFEEGVPLAATAVDLDGDGRVELAFVDEQERVRSVVVARSSDAGATWAEIRRTELEDLRSDPVAIESIDADQDGRLDLIVYTPQSPLRILVQDAGGSFEDVSSTGRFRKGLVEDLTPLGMGEGDVDGDGISEMIVAGNGYARALRLSSENRLDVVDQFNATDSDSEVQATFVVDVDANGAPELLLARIDVNEIAVLRRDRFGVFRQRSSIPVGSIDLVDTQVVDLAADGRMDLLFLGRDRFWTAPVGTVDYEVETLQRHETDHEEMAYVELAAGDLDGDGVEDLVAVDSHQTRILEILTRNGDRELTTALHFTVFEVDPHYQGRQGTRAEPRELVVSDLTGDDKLDIALLVHDRVLLYPGR